MRSQEERAAEQQGWNARHAGRSTNTNPYLDGGTSRQPARTSKLYGAWQRGWIKVEFMLRKIKPAGRAGSGGS